jgi:UDP-N-acetyl-D-galactosamine dehydrogenase
MGKFIAEQTIKVMISCGSYVKGARVNILGLTFKEKGIRKSVWKMP